MEAMREAWTDHRPDDLVKHMDQDFERVDRNFERVDTEFRELRAEMNSRFDSVDRRFDALEARFDGLQRTLMVVGGPLAVAVLANAVASHL